MCSSSTTTTATTATTTATHTNTNTPTANTTMSTTGVTNNVQQVHTTTATTIPPPPPPQSAPPIPQQPSTTKIVSQRPMNTEDPNKEPVNDAVVDTADVVVGVNVNVVVPKQERQLKQRQQSPQRIVSSSDQQLQLVADNVVNDSIKVDTVTAMNTIPTIPAAVTSMKSTQKMKITKCKTSSATAAKTKTQTTLQKSAQSLSNEMKGYITSKSRTTAYRAASYRPSIDTFQRVSFADYVRCVLLGVEGLDGVESEDPFYSDDDSSNNNSDDDNSDDDDDDDDNNDTSSNRNGGSDNVKEEDKNENKSQVNKKIETDKNNDVTTCIMHIHNQEGKGEEKNEHEKMNLDDDNKNNHDDNDDNEHKSPCCCNNENEQNDSLLQENSTITNQKSIMTLSSSSPSSTSLPTQTPTRNTTNEESIQNNTKSMTNTNLNNNDNTPSPSQTKPTASTAKRITRSTRMTTRTQTKSIPTPPSPEKENIYSRPYYITPKMRREQSKKIEGKQHHINDNDNARTEAKATTTGTTKREIAIKKGNSKKRNNPSSNGNNDNILVPEPQKLELNGLKLSDGIGKITPPKGWWDHAGIGGDLTGRGQPWQKGTKLGDLLIPSPIKQCVYGIGGVYEFTMMELPSTTVADFRKDADAYRKSQIGEAIDDDISDEKMDLLARKFWKRLGPTMTSSKYGADMEGTLFDGVEACGWNVDKLESCLQLLLADLNHRDIQDMKKDKFTEEDLRMPGVTSAYLYFGMWASVFCAHTEDMNLCSINYLHAGAPKYWYAISPQDSGRFESLMASMFSHQSAQCKEFLRHKRSLISPSILTKAGIEYTTQVQRAGDIMITYPGSYHFGFNTGFNVAESTNFAVPEWVPLGEEARVCMCHPHSVRIEMNRFKSLLYQYEKDQIINIQKNRTKMSYLEWARENVRSRICKRPRGSDKEDDIESIVQPSQSSSRYSKKGTVVEVMKLIKKAKNIQTNGGGGKQAKKRKKVTSKTKKNQKDDDYRLALRVKKSSFNDRRQTPVLCVLECDSNYHYFAGTVNAVVEDHARIHFAGTSKEDDIWMDVGSDMLFLDGGSCEKP